MDEGTAQRLGARIALLRGEQGLSLGDLSERTGIAKSYLSRLEKGESLNLGLVTLSAVAKSLGLTVHNLLPRPETDESSNTETPALTNATKPAEVHFETISESVPEPLQAFLDEEAELGTPIPADAVRALAVLKLRGKHPESKDDYRLLYGLLRRLIP